jgi:predicted ATPase
MQIKDLPDNLKPYEFHGHEVSWNGGTLGHSHCPFCDTPKKLGIKVRTGQYRCVKCNEHGNVSKWVQTVYDMSELNVDSPAIIEILEDRKCSVQALEHFGVKVNFITGEVIVPQYNQKGIVCNLSKVVTGFKLYSTATCNMYPFGTENIKSQQGLIWVVEGLWDALALFDTLNKLQDGEEGVILKSKKSKEQPLFKFQGIMAVPGCNSWQDHWAHWLRKKDVRVVFDNDYPKELRGGSIIQPAYDGAKRMGLSLLRQNKAKQPRTVQQVVWGETTYHTEDLADGYDIRDLVRDRKNVRSYKYLTERLEDLEIDVEEDYIPKYVDPLERSTFDSLLDDYKERLHITEQFEDVLAVMTACVISTEFKGDKLWIRVIGPPGSGKSTVAEAISACTEYVLPISFQTGFHSGYSSSKSGKEAGLMTRIQNKTVIIKDGDTLLQSANRDRVMAELRDMYDGTSRAVYRNRKESNYDNIKTHFIICGTDELRSLNSSSLGERFLDIEMLGDTDTTPFVDSAFSSSVNLISSNIGNPSADTEDTTDTLTLKRATTGYILNLKDQINKISPPKISRDTEAIIKKLAYFVSRVRATVKRDREELVERPRPELATRLTQQYVKLAISLAITLNKNSVDGRCVSILQKVTRTTLEGFRLEILDLLSSKPNGATVAYIEQKLTIGETRIRKILDDMKVLKLVRTTKRPNKTGQRGRDAIYWRLTSQILDIYREALK